jgi:hypothetical protein
MAPHNQYQPKAPKVPKRAPKANPNASNIPPPGLSAQALAQWTANHGKKAPKPIDRYGIGTWTSTENTADWNATLAWLLNGSTAPAFATQVKTIGGKQYIGNDHDGYVQYTRGFQGPPTIAKMPAQKGLTGRASFQNEPGTRKPGVKINADELVDQFNTLAKNNAPRFGQVQSLLFQAGYYGADQPVIGSFSGTDQHAFITALADAHTAGQSLQDYLADRAAKRAAQGFNAGPQRIPLTIGLTDPKTIEAAVNSPTSLNASGISNASQAIGRTLTPDELKAYIDKIHNGERWDQTAADNASPHYQSAGDTTPLPKGGEVIDPNAAGPSGGEVDLALKEAHPAEYQATHMGEQASRIYQILTAHAPGGVQQ